MAIAVAWVCASCNDPAGSDSPDDQEPSWLQSHAVPLNSADPATPDQNLLAFVSAVGNARIVGLGEATHGTREFWTMRQKLTGYLVEELGFTAILHEAPFATSLAIHDYVVEGEGSPLEAHQRLGYWRFQEMQELMAWIREHNLQRGDGDPVLHYYGYDCAFRSWAEPTAHITEYLQAVDPGAVAEIRARLDNHALEDARYVYGFLEARAEEYIANSSAREYAVILKVAENLEPAWQVWYALENGLPEGDIREECAASNVNWIIDNLLDGGKAVIWAHNAHIGNPTLTDISGSESVWLGTRLKEQLGQGYYMLGAEFYGGSFQAWEYCGSEYTSFMVHQAAPPPQDTYAHRFHEAGIPLFFLNLGGVDYTTEEASWLMGPLDLRFIGADYCRANDGEYYYPARLPEHFDGVVYFESTTPVASITF